MQSYDVLKKVPLFADLPEADLEHLCQEIEEVQLAAGEELFAEGSPGDRAYVVTEGQLEVIKVSSGREVLLNVLEPVEVVGEMALLEDKPRMASVRARTDSTLLAISKELIEHLLKESASATGAMFHTILARWRITESMLRQSEKMAQLGTLTAGVAHELNNPAAAVQRGAGQLQDTITQLQHTQSLVDQSTLTDQQQKMLADLTKTARQHATRPPELDALVRSDRESQLEAWLEERDVSDAWELTSTLVNLEFDTDGLAALAETFHADQLTTVIAHVNATYTVHNLLAEISQGAGRISEIVKALKSYSFLDQAPTQSVNIHEGIDNTLLILRSKLKDGISVRREYGPDMPKIEAFGSELNQVWTNILDNAADALDGRGEITIRTRREGDWVIVEITDNGPGIPPEIQSRIFDAFFTTKAPGHGTGLGLDISYNIVVYRHRGDIKVVSEPGKTSFSVWLPINLGTK